MQKHQVLNTKTYNSPLKWVQEVWQKDKIVCLSVVGLYLSYYFLPPSFVLMGAVLLMFYILSSLSSKRVLAGTNLLVLSIFFLSVPSLSQYVIAQVKTNLTSPPEINSSSEIKTKLDFTQAKNIEPVINQSLGVGSSLPGNELNQIQEKLKSIDWTIENYFTVSKVYSADTLELENFGVVNLVGVQAPLQILDSNNINKSGSAANCFYDQSKSYLSDKVINKKVSLKFDEKIGQIDKAGRVLVFLKLSTGVFINQEVIKDGQAKLSDYSFQESFQTDLWEAQAFAQKYQVGVWSPTNCGSQSSLAKQANAKQNTAINPSIKNEQSTQTGQSPELIQPEFPSSLEHGKNFSPTRPNHLPADQKDLLIPDFDAYDKALYDTNKDGNITCEDFENGLTNIEILNKYPNLRRDKDGIACRLIPVTNNPETKPSKLTPPPISNGDQTGLDLGNSKSLINPNTN